MALEMLEMIAGDPIASVAYRIKTYFEGTQEIKTLKAIGELYQAIINFQSLENLVTVLKKMIDVFEKTFTDGKVDRDSI